MFRNPLSLFWIIGFRHYFVDFESFQKQKRQQHTFFVISFYQYFFLSKNRIILVADSHTIYNFFIEKVFLSIPTKFPLGFETWLIWILSISLSKIYLRSCSNLLINTNPRPFALEKWINTFYSSSIMYYFHYTPTINVGFEWNKGCRVKSILYYRMMDIKIHNGLCPSSRTLLFTTSFQTKFYHNIPRIWNRYAVDSIMESWIVIGSVKTVGTSISNLS